MQEKYDSEELKLARKEGDRTTKEEQLQTTGLVTYLRVGGMVYF